MPAEPIEHPQWNVNEEYTRFTLLRKLFLLLKSYFTRTSVYELTTELLLKRIKAGIETAAPGLIDFKAGRFAIRMKRELESLKPGLGFLRAVLKGIAKRKDFISFLAGIDLDPLNEQIVSDTDPKDIFGEPDFTEDRVIRSEMWRRFERLVGEITPARKTAVQRDVQGLQAIEALATFPVEEMIMTFAPEEQSSEPQSAGGASPDELPSLIELSAGLTGLCEAISGTRNPPSPMAWNALFLYRASEAIGDPEFNPEREAAAFLSRAMESLGTIRDFHRRVPLAEIVRYIRNDIDYRPPGPKGGEEWFVQFKNFWEDRLEATLDGFFRDRRKLACISEALDLLAMSHLPYLENYRQEKFGELFTIRHETSLAIIQGFYEKVFLPKIDRFLKLIHINGDFYKEENRAAFTDCFETLSRIYEKVGLLDGRLSAEGDWGRAFTEIQGQAESPEGREKFLTLMGQADQEAKRLSEMAYATLSQISRILFGILYGEMGSPYDSIANLGSIGGRENKSIIKGLEEAIKYFDRTSTLLADVRDAEMG